LRPGKYTLEVTTRSPLGEETVKEAVEVREDVRVLLVSDKPVYQPGQLMHLRALALSPMTLRPLPGTDILFEVEDPKGNKVFKQCLNASPYGVAATDFQLAGEVNLGDYQVRALLGDHQAQRTVGVKRYTLPKFKIQVRADKKFYAPRQTIGDQLEA